MKAFRKSGAYAGLVLIIAVFLLPFYIMFYLSLSGPADSIAQEWFPRAMLFQNFADAWSKADMGFADDLYRRDSGFDLLRGLRRLRGGQGEEQVEPGGVSCDGPEHDGAGHHQYGALIHYYAEN